MKDVSRRRFISLTATAGAGLILTPQISEAFASSVVGKREQGLVFLFQGDSITDGNRGRNTDPNHIMGHGYAFAVASRLAADFPESNLVFYNRGISGNTLPDLKKRWQTDTLDLKPDVLSLLIGINDVYKTVSSSSTAQSLEDFESDYCDLLKQCRKSNPDMTFVLGTPFVFPSQNVSKNWDEWRTNVEKRAEVVKRLAAEFQAVLVNYTPVFNKAIKIKEAQYWIWDGIHPTIAGHELMARAWIKQASSRLKFLKKYKY